MQVAVLIDRSNSLLANIYHRYGLILEVYTDATALSLHIDECDVVRLLHGVVYTAHLNLNAAIAEVSDYWNMLLATRIYSVGNELLHLLAAAYHGYS